ncbi:CoA transferase [Verticiella sediminum]|uniref:CoA transferase n=1 Tax=Verticiella sediminum TaxID=1247510 RepID=A0A556AZJ8_9BURK|nr:CaiB/BaiF CoA-transferase family protein [Verticiella sediminum]TSH98363.1 CoA transferase [Verticiella sediminum]
MIERYPRGPLAGVRIVEFAGIGPGPVCGMLLADMGADVLLIERPDSGELGIPRPRRCEVGHRGKASLVLDLRQPEALETARDLLAHADALIEGFRPGAMERLGLGPDECLAANPGLVYGRMTGYGQRGALAARAGHDINYIALSGALHAIGRAGGPPTPPLNLVGDYAGGSMLLAFGIAAALVERARSGRGQVIDASMVEGAGLLMSSFFGMRAAGLAPRPRGENLLDSGAPFYDVYRCSDGGYVAFGAIERRFRRVFAERTGFPLALLLDDDPVHWPRLREALAEFFAQRTRDAWCALLEDSDACVTPVLAPEEVGAHRHNAGRRSFLAVDGVLQPAPAPRFSRSDPAMPGRPPEPGEGGAAMAESWGTQRPRSL